MTATDTAAETTARCLDCRRPIRSAESLATGRGAGCRAKIRRAARQADLSAWTASQVEEAEQAIADGAVVPSTREGVFHVISSDGSEVHRTSEHGCNCTNGLKTRPPRPCWHRCAVEIVLAAYAPAATKAPAVVRAIAPAPVTAPAEDIWARSGVHRRPRPCACLLTPNRAGRRPRFPARRRP
jgi:hypothetical protein